MLFQLDIKRIVSDDGEIHREKESIYIRSPLSEPVSMIILAVYFYSCRGDSQGRILENKILSFSPL